MSARGYRLTAELRYAQAARRAQYLLRLVPQGAAAPAVSVAPFVSFRSDCRDGFGNWQCHVALDAPHDQLRVDHDGAAEFGVDGPVPALAWEKIRDELGSPRSPAALDAAVFLGKAGDAARAPEDIAPPFASGMLLSHILDRARTETSGQGLDQVADGFRRRGLAARFVSGVAIAPTGSAASRIWLEVYAGEGRWVAVDPEAASAGQQRTVLAVGLTLDDVAPLRVIAVGAGNWSAALSVKLT